MAGTIFAVATAPGKAGVAIIRISGPAAHAAAEAISGPLPEPHRAALRTFRDPAGAPIDEGVLVLFPEGASFTGEDVAELQVHGAPAIQSRLLALLGDMEGLRSAGAGEFTRRALEAGRMDLAQVEGLADLIDAETEVQRAQAMRVYGGAAGG